MYRYNLLLCIRIPYTRRHSTTDDPSFFIHFETILYVPPLTPPPFEKTRNPPLLRFLQSQPPLFYCYNIICWRVQNMKFSIIRCYPCWYNFLSDPNIFSRAVFSDSVYQCYSVSVGENSTRICNWNLKLILAVQWLLLWIKNGILTLAFSN